MGFLFAIEGADGVGKRTATTNVARSLESRGYSVSVLSFPRYGETVGGVVLGDFLSGRLPVSVTPSAAAVLYALDRFESCNAIRIANVSSDFVIFDRYIASNIVYQSAKVLPSEVQAMMEWIARLETDVFGLPMPNLSILLDTPIDMARQLIHLKEKRSYTESTLDEHEIDIELQRRVRSNYLQLSETRLIGAWVTVKTTRQDRLRSPTDIAEQIVDCVLSSSGQPPVKGGSRAVTSSRA